MFHHNLHDGSFGGICQFCPRNRSSHRRSTEVSEKYLFWDNGPFFLILQVKSKKCTTYECVTVCVFSLLSLLFLLLVIFVQTTPFKHIFTRFWSFHYFLAKHKYNLTNILGRKEFNSCKEFQKVEVWHSEQKFLSERWCWRLENHRQGIHAKSY